jgi:hypothetical protein
MPDTEPVDVQRTGTAPGPASGDWPAQAADTIVRVVGQVRDKTTGPIQKAARGAVYGVLAALLGIACLVLLAIVLVRILDSYVVGEDNTWLAHLIVGVVFLLAGSVLWGKGRQPAEG